MFRRDGTLLVSGVTGRRALGLAAQSDPARAIPWAAPLEHGDLLEDALVSVPTYLIENETAALLVPARFAAQVQPHSREVQQQLAIQAVEEALERRSAAIGRRHDALRETSGLNEEVFDALSPWRGLARLRGGRRLLRADALRPSPMPARLHSRARRRPESPAHARFHVSSGGRETAIQAAWSIGSDG